MSNPVHFHPAFAAPLHLAPSIRSSSNSLTCLPHFPQPRHAIRSRSRNVLRMTVDDPGKQQASDQGQEERTPTEREKEEPQFSTWGVASFAIIFAIFMVGILATLSRDFIPGGLVGPAQGSL